MGCTSEACSLIRPDVDRFSWHESFYPVGSGSASSLLSALQTGTLEMEVSLVQFSARWTLAGSEHIQGHQGPLSSCRAGCKCRPRWHRQVSLAFRGFDFELTYIFLICIVHNFLNSLDFFNLADARYDDAAAVPCLRGGYDAGGWDDADDHPNAAHGNGPAAVSDARRVGTRGQRQQRLFQNPALQ